MNDLEDRLRDELSGRAAGLRFPPASGAGVRTAAALRRTRRRVGTAVGIVSVVAVLTTGHGIRSAGTAPVAPAARPGPTPSAVSSAQTVPSDLVAAVRAGVVIMGDGWQPLLSVPHANGAQTVLLTGRGPKPPVEVLAATVRAGKVVGGYAYAHFGSLDSDVVTLPVSDGETTSLLVVAPAGLAADRAVVSVSRPDGAAPTRVTRPVVGGIALVPVPDALSPTRLVLLRGGEVVDDRVPADLQLDAAVPRTLERVVAMSGRGGQRVQVRSDEKWACRFTVADLSPADQVPVGWNPFDTGCARLDGSLQLLLAEDRIYSSVTGVAPAGSRSVRLVWKDGTSTTVPVAPGNVPAFLDGTVSRDRAAPASELERAEALDADGRILARAEPSPRDRTKDGT